MCWRMLTASSRETTHAILHASREEAVCQMALGDAYVGARDEIDS